MKYQYLTEEVEMKERNREEDQYITELKNKQYCLLIKKILSSIIDLGMLEHCDDIEELLEVGSQQAVQKKREARDIDSIRKKEESRGDYQIHFNSKEEGPRLFNFGTEISSHEDIGFLSHRDNK
jgi:hypothetical protein